MKLPDFEVDIELNALRKAMGAELRDYTAAPSSDVLTIDEIERLAGEGIEIFTVVRIGESFVGDERAYDGARDEGGMPFGVVEAGEGDGIGLRSDFAGRFEVPITVKENAIEGEIISEDSCCKSQAENDREQR